MHLDGRGDERDEGDGGSCGGTAAGTSDGDAKTVASSDGSNVYGNSIISIVLNLTDIFVIASMLLDIVMS